MCNPSKRISAELSLCAKRSISLITPPRWAGTKQPAASKTLATRVSNSTLLKHSRSCLAVQSLRSQWSFGKSMPATLQIAFWFPQLVTSRKVPRLKNAFALMLARTWGTSFVAFRAKIFTGMIFKRPFPSLHPPESSRSIISPAGFNTQTFPLPTTMIIRSSRLALSPLS